MGSQMVSNSRMMQPDYNSNENELHRIRIFSCMGYDSKDLVMLQNIMYHKVMS